VPAVAAAGSAAASLTPTPDSAVLGGRELLAGVSAGAVAKPRVRSDMDMMDVNESV